MLNVTVLPVVSLSCVMALSALQPTNAPTPTEPIAHVSGESPEIRSAELDGVRLYAVGDVSTEAQLPKGYPRPTPPGVVELKLYPDVRRAEFTIEGAPEGAARRGFMPLFLHITRNRIGMTSPVEMRRAEDGWVMSFPYPSPDIGKAGSDGAVRIVDEAPVTVLSLGVRGGGDFTELLDREQALLDWLDEHDAWEQAGPVRTLGYNSRGVPPARRWWEIQLPVRPTSPAPAPSVGD